MLHHLLISDFESGHVTYSVKLRTNVEKSMSAK